MSNVIDFEPKIRTRQQYLDACKQYICEEQYAEFLCAILDEDYYRDAGVPIQMLVNNYRKFAS